MPSPNNGKRTSSLSLGRQSVAAIRRGDVKISDPIPPPTDKADEAFALGQEVVNNNSSRSTTPATDGTWPRRNTPPENTPLPGSEGGGRDRSRLALNRESAGPSVLLSAMSSKTSLKQRKSGGFRATVRSLFGSKRNRSALSSNRSYHISDPGNLISICEKPIDRHGTRTPSQTIPRPIQASPLGSHSPFVPLESKGTRSADRLANIPGQRRRNTLPSVVFSDQDAQYVRNVVDRTNAKEEVEMSPNSKQTDQMPKALKRRSRSADALTDLVAMQAQSPSTWIQSLLDQPLPTFTSQGARKIGTGMSTTRSSRLTSTVSSNSLKPVQNFDFGLLGDVSLEDRVKTLEIKCVNFEYAIAGLQGYDVETPVPTSRPPKRRSIHDLFVETTVPPSSRATSGQMSFLKSPADSSSPSDEDRRHMQRSSATTIRPSNPTARSRSPKRSAASSPITISLKSNQYDGLLALIKEERAARTQLEAQVLKLQKQLNACTTTPPTLYTTLSLESIRNEGVENKARPLHRTPAFPRRSRNNLAETSRFSVSDTEESETDNGFHDVYGTPWPAVEIF